MIQSLPGPIRRYVWGPLAILIAFSPLVLSQVLQMMTIVILPFSRPLFRRLNTIIAAGVWGYWSWLLQNVAGTKVVVTGDPIPRGEDAIVIANHQSMGDIVVVLCLAAPRARVGHLKWLVKDVIKYVPGVGWGMMFLDCVFLKRNWNRDADTIRRVFSRIADNKLPVWLVSFPEGTRATPAKLAVGKAKEKARGGPSLEHLLRPKHKGFAASIVGLGSHVKAVYTVTIGYHGATPSLVGLIRGDCKEIAMHVKRTPIAELLHKDEAAIAAWMSDEFQRKDKWLAEFSQAHRVPKSAR